MSYYSITQSYRMWKKLATIIHTLPNAFVSRGFETQLDDMDSIHLLLLKVAIDTEEAFYKETEDGLLMILLDVPAWESLAKLARLAEVFFYESLTLNNQYFFEPKPVEVQVYNEVCEMKRNIVQYAKMQHDCF